MTMVDDEQVALRAENARLQAREAELKAQVAHAQQTVQGNGALLQAIENFPFSFWARDKDGYCVMQNASSRARWGVQLHKRFDESGLPSQMLETWSTHHRRALAGEIVRAEYEYEKDGETRYASNVLAPMRTHEGIVGTVGINIDVTEYKRALVALRASQDKLRMAVDTAGIGVWTWNLGRDEVVWEPALSAIFGLPPGTSPRGRDGYLALVHPDDREATAAKIVAGMKVGRWEDEYRIIRADGAVRWVMGKGALIRDAEGARCVGAAMDVTERREREEQLRQAQKLEAIGQLTAGIAHNFNNMLMGLLPNLELAAQRAPADLVPLLADGAESARRAAELVRNLVTYAGRNRPGTHTVEEIGPLVERTVELCRRMFDRRITFDLSYEAGARSLVDATQFEQALLNLLINARDALAGPEIDSPRLSVSVCVVGAGADELGDHAGDHVRVRVSDNGTGMAEATRQRIYEPFFTTKGPGKGTGLGLATTRAIVHEQGGFICCESAKRLGTTFSVYLPLEDAPASSTRARSEVPAGGSETVLVVDDEPLVRDAITRLLESGGYAILQAGSGDEALALLDDPAFASRVGLILLDVSMPGPPRGELRRRLRDVTPARILYLSGYSLDDLDTGADDAVLQKPVTQALLLRSVRRELDRH